MGAKCLAVDRISSYQDKNLINKNSFEKKYLIGKGGLSKVI